MTFSLYELHTPFKLGDIVVLDKTISIMKNGDGTKTLVQSAFLNGMEDLVKFPKHRTFLVVEENVIIGTSLRIEVSSATFLHQLNGVTVVPYDLSTPNNVNWNDRYLLQSFTRQGLAKDNNFPRELLDVVNWLRPDQSRVIGYCRFDKKISRNSDGKVSDSTTFYEQNLVIKLTAEIGPNGKFLPEAEINAGKGQSLENAKGKVGP